MARREANKAEVRQRLTRYFSEEFKKGKVRDIERGTSSVGEVHGTYEVSCTSVYRWLERYSPHRKKGIRMVVEAKNDTRKIIALKEKQRELKQLLGQKEVELACKSKLIELAEAHYGVELKKVVSPLSVLVLGAPRTSLYEHERIVPAYVHCG